VRRERQFAQGTALGRVLGKKEEHRPALTEEKKPHNGRSRKGTVSAVDAPGWMLQQKKRRWILELKKRKPLGEKKGPANEFVLSPRKKKLPTRRGAVTCRWGGVRKGKCGSAQGPIRSHRKRARSYTRTEDESRRGGGEEEQFVRRGKKGHRKKSEFSSGVKRKGEFSSKGGATFKARGGEEHLPIPRGTRPLENLL